MAQGAVPQGQNDKVRVNSSDSSAGFLEDKVVSSDGSVTITTSSCNCSIDLSATPGGVTETWIKTTVTFADFNSASATVDFTPTEFTGLPAGFNVLFFKFKHSTSFTGGSASATTIGLKFGLISLPSHDVFQATANTIGYFDDGGTSTTRIPDQAATSDLEVRLSVTGDTCDNLTAGSCDIWVKIATLI
jgi:hypothetical protein